MGRPKASPTRKHSRIVAVKLTEAQGDVWDQLRRKIGGGPIVPGESAVLRLLMEEECVRRGLAWPREGDAQAAAPTEYQQPEEATPLRAAESSATYGTGQRFVEPDEAEAPSTPTKAARKRSSR